MITSSDTSDTSVIWPPSLWAATAAPGPARIHQLGPSGFAWVGCNGCAVALSISLGRELARATQGAPIETLGPPLSEPKPRPFQSVVRKVAPFALPLYRRLDATEI